MRVQSFLSLAPAQSVTATVTGSSFDISDFKGNGYVVLNSGAMGGTTPTSNVKLQHSDDNSTWVDSSFAFAQVTTTASYQPVFAPFEQFKKYVRVVNTVTGTSPTQAFSVEIVGTKRTQ